MTTLETQGQAAKAASRHLAAAGSQEKDRALHAIADALLAAEEEILAANQLDLEAGRAAGMSQSLLDRLALSPARIQGMAQGARDVAAQKDPIGEVVEMGRRPNGLIIGQRRVPLGVIAIIYEARPNVTVDAAALCLKAGNAVILRGGRDALHSNQILERIMRQAIAESGLPEASVQLVQDSSREAAQTLMRMRQYVDVLIPRGGKGLIQSVVDSASVPVIETGWGNCHVYIDQGADLDLGAQIIFNAKCSRPSVCNAAETLLVAESEAAAFLPKAKALLDQKNTQLRGDEKTRAILGDCVLPATAEDWDTEYGDYILAVKVVPDLEAALAHISAHSSGHSEAIVTRDYARAQRFLDAVDSAAVYVNASTRFTDGGEFGLGAEIGISTQKLHARGPMGVYALTSTKFVIYGDGQIR